MTLSFRPAIALLGLSLLFASRGGYAHKRITYEGPVSETAVLSTIHHANQMEVKMGQLAQQNGNSQAIRDYGATLVKDHTAADKKVHQASREDGVVLESAPMSQDEVEAWNHLSTIHGTAFDQAFSETMESDHTEMINVLDYDLGQLPESRTQSLVSTLLPQLRRHRETAKHLVAQVHPVVVDSGQDLP